MSKPIAEAYLRHRAEIAKMLDERFWPLWWVESQISEGNIDLLWNDTAIIGFEVRKYPGGARELHGMFAAGQVDGIDELVDAACEVARGIGAFAAIDSRPGWARRYKNKGFRVDRVRIVKDMGDGPQRVENH